MSAAPVDGLAVEQLAAYAAEAVRAINHLTRPGIGELSGPAQVDAVVAELACLAARLPQLLTQLGRWLHAEQQHGRLRVDSCSPHADSAAAVTTVVEQLAQAGGAACHTGRALDAAHQTLAHLAASDGERRPQ